MNPKIKIKVSGFADLTIESMNDIYSVHSGFLGVYPDSIYLVPFETCNHFWVYGVFGKGESLMGSLQFKDAVKLMDFIRSVRGGYAK